MVLDTACFLLVSRTCREQSVDGVCWHNPHLQGGQCPPQEASRAKCWGEGQAFWHFGKGLLHFYDFLGNCGCHWAPPYSFTGRGSGKTGSTRNLVAAQKHPGSCLCHRLYSHKMASVCQCLFKSKITTLGKHFCQAIGRGEESGGRSGTITLRFFPGMCYSYIRIIQNCQV